MVIQGPPEEPHFISDGLAHIVLKWNEGCLVSYGPWFVIILVLGILYLQSILHLVLRNLLLLEQLSLLIFSQIVVRGLIYFWKSLFLVCRKIIDWGVHHRVFFQGWHCWWSILSFRKRILSRYKPWYDGVRLWAQDLVFGVLIRDIRWVNWLMRCSVLSSIFLDSKKRGWHLRFLHNINKALVIGREDIWFYRGHNVASSWLIRLKLASPERIHLTPLPGYLITNHLFETFVVDDLALFDDKNRIVRRALRRLLTLIDLIFKKVALFRLEL